MAENKKTATSQGAQPQAAPGIFKVRTPNRGFTRKHTCGIQFVNGAGETQSEAAAQHCAEIGYEVTLPNGKVINPLGETKAEKADRERAEELQATREAADGEAAKK